MDPLYPDNSNRAKRVTQLATQLEMLQPGLNGDLANIKVKDERILKELDKVLKAAGYKTRAEYVAAALKRLTPEQRKVYEYMRKQLQSTDEGLEISWFVSGALFGIAAFSGLASATITIVLNLSMVRMSLYAMEVGFVNVLKGNLKVGINLIRSAGRAMSTVLDGTGLSEKFLTAMRYLKNAVKVLLIIVVIPDGLHGAQLRAALKEAIFGLCIRRFGLLKMKLSILACDIFTDEASNIVTTRVDMNELVKQGVITAQVADKVVANKIEKAVGTIQKGMDIITDDHIWEQCRVLDTGTLVPSWTNEDPWLVQVLVWIELQVDDSRHDDDVRWRIEIPRQWRDIYPPEEKIISHEKQVDVKVCVSVFPAKL